MILFVAVSIFVLFSSLFPHDTILKNRYISRSFVFVLIAMMIAYIPTLNVYVSDMVRYVRSFKEMSDFSLFEILKYYDWEPLFLVTQWFISRFTENQVVYVIFTFLMFCFLLYTIAKKMFLPWQRMFFIFIFFCYPFFYMFVFDVIRQGIAMFLLILSTTYMLDKKKHIKFFVCIVAAGLFHDTAFMMGGALAIVFLFNFKLKTYLFVWSITAILFLTGFNSSILNFDFIRNIGYVDIYTQDFRIKNFGGGVNKISYFIYSSFFLIVSLFLYKYLILEEYYKKTYFHIIKCYLGFNALFLLFGFIAYSNRIAMYSWFLVPLLVAYPILHKKKHSSWLLFLLILVSFLSSFFYSPFIAYK